MGPYQSVNDKRQKFIQMFINNYELQQQLEDTIFGQVEVYRNKSTKIPQIMLKKITYVQQNEFKVISDQLSNRIITPLPNLLGIYCVKVHQQKSFCGSIYQVKIYAQYLKKTLKDELKKRRKHNNYFFSEQQLWKILISLTNAIKYLHQNNIFHGEIRVQNVMIDGDLHMKLAEKTLLPKHNWEVELQTENVTLIKGRGVLFSPILLQCLYHKKTQLSQFDPFKADVYAVGMIMLECSCLKKAEDFYDYERFSIKQKEIFTALYEIRKKYSPEFCNLLSRMLEEEDVERPKAAEIFQKIRKIPNETIKELNMTLRESFLTESIRSYM